VAVRPGESGASQRYEVESTWFHNGTLIFKFRGVDAISEAETLAGLRCACPWASGRRWTGRVLPVDLVGCEVVNRRTGESLGRVSGWEDSGGSGLLVWKAVY